MKIAIIACRTLENELLDAMKRTGCHYPVHWLPPGEHNIAHKRAAQIRQALACCAGCDRVILAMSLCGGCVQALGPVGMELIVPRCDDCITLLLGSAQRRKEFPATYFFTEGWLNGESSLWAEYRRTGEKYGPARAERIFSAMLAHYRQLAFLDTGCGDISDRVRQIAGTLNLEYIRIGADLSYLEDLLKGCRDDRFLVISPALHALTVLPDGIRLTVPHGKCLLDALRENHTGPEAPCGGQGTCGKCRVLLDGKWVPACRTFVDRDMAVTLPEAKKLRIPDVESSENIPDDRDNETYLLAFDIGTTGVVCWLLREEDGRELAVAGAKNPQSCFGADVVSRIRAAREGHMEALTASVRECMSGLIREVCRKARTCPDRIGTVSVVGNPAMRQLFLGIPVDNLARIPFAPALTDGTAVPCADILPLCPRANILIPADISGFVGADTVGCILAANLHRCEDVALLVDIGTNAELVLSCRGKLTACAAAAGPALEGACIRFGTVASPGAIDRVWLENGQVCCSVIGGGKATGICGSGLIDAVSVMLELGVVNRRGRIQTGDRCFHLTKDVYLTQEDIRQVQLAKGAIHAGIVLLAKHRGIAPDRIDRVLLAGAFGAHINPENACRIGLFPRTLSGKILPIGNAAGTGAKMLAEKPALLDQCQTIRENTEFLELASLADFPKTFGRCMGFDPENEEDIPPQLP